MVLWEERGEERRVRYSNESVGRNEMCVCVCVCNNERGWGGGRGSHEDGNGAV